MLDSRKGILVDQYKKIIRNKKVRICILSMLRFVPDKQMLQMQYYIKHKQFVNLSNPTRFTEKLQWYKLFYRDTTMARCADKYLVREYVTEKGLGNILNELYCVYDNAESIDVNSLPDCFALKLSSGSGDNVFCKSAGDISEDKVKGFFRNRQRIKSASVGREWVYGVYKPTILAEKFLNDPEFKDGIPTDYKFFCFNGKPEYIVCIPGRHTSRENHLYYNTKWEKLDVVTENGRLDEDIRKPDNLDEMLRVAKVLSEDFPFARVDLYNIEGKIIFGEITFFPWSGYMEFEPDSFDFELGEKFILPQKNN